MSFSIEEYLTVEEAAAKMGYTKANITRLIREGKLQAYKRGRRYMILPEDLDALVVESQLLG